MTALTGPQFDRACGVLVATAAGDALGAPYEFGPPLADAAVVSMSGSDPGGREPGGWTDDTAMAVAIAEVAATGADLRSPAAQDRIVRRWLEWARTATDIGVQTSAVLAGVDPSAASPAAQARASAEALHRRTGRSAGNGSLMRTAPVALAFLQDEDGLVDAATQLSTLTHHDPEAGEACVLWCLAIRHAVHTGRLDLRRGLDRLPAHRASVWSRRLDAAEAARPADFEHNGWVVEALQAAWCALATTPVPPDDPGGRSFRAEHVQRALEEAVRGGRDTDTVAAIAGGLVGAVHGLSAVPAHWRRVLHGWPGIRVRELVELVRGVVEAGEPDRFDDTYARYGRIHPVTRHPDDDGLWLGGISALRALPPQVDAVVSLCRVGADDLPRSVIMSRYGSSTGRGRTRIWPSCSTTPCD